MGQKTTHPVTRLTRPVIRTSDQFWNVIDDVWHQRVKRADVEMNGETQSGHTVLATIYRVNEHVPVRVDFKPKGGPG